MCDMWVKLCYCALRSHESCDVVTECPPGQFKAEVGPGGCEVCPDRSTSMYTGSTSCQCQGNLVWNWKMKACQGQTVTQLLLKAYKLHHLKQKFTSKRILESSDTLSHKPFFEL